MGCGSPTPGSGADPIRQRFPPAGRRCCGQQSPMTWGLLEVAAGHSWPSKEAMQKQGHGVKCINDLIDPHLGAAVRLPVQP